MKKQVTHPFSFFFLFLALLGGHSLAAQTTGTGNADDDEIIVFFDDSATEMERASMRFLYSVWSFETLGDGNIELWKSITFPQVVNTAAGPVTLNSPLEMLDHILNTGNGNVDDDRVVINDGDLNHFFSLPEPPPFPALPNNQPLPNCDNDTYRIIGPGGAPATTPVPIIVIDQLVSHNFNGTEIHAISFTDQVGGTHGNKVTSVINKVLNDAGLPYFGFYNFAPFDFRGSSTYADLLRVFFALEEYNLSHAIINLSASIQYQPGNGRGGLIWDEIDRILSTQNLLLITSAGNDSYDGSNVFPGGMSFANEITAVGTSNCFSNLWSFSNHNAQIYEIAAEAEDILTFDGTYHWLSSGTSYAAPLVTAAAAQIAARMPVFDAQLIKQTLLASADQNPNLMTAVQQGRVLNVSAAINNMGGGVLLQGTATDQADAIVEKKDANTPLAQVSPNPFTDQLQLQLSTAREVASVQLSLTDVLGRVQQREQFSIPIGLTSLDWDIDSRLPSGIYWLHLQVGDEITTQKIIKR